jgi:two-component system, sensor histidine kinase and response regulator
MQLHYPFSPSIFEQLKVTFQQMADFLGDSATLITDNIFKCDELTIVHNPYFSLLIAPKFNALLLVQNNDDHPEKIYLDLMFDSVAIATFITQLRENFTAHQQALLCLTNLQQLLGDNDSKLQGQFTMLLLQNIDLSIPSYNHNPPHHQISVCQPIANALEQQIQQENLLNAVTISISSSLELPVILETAVTQVRQFLTVDRLVIYQFNQETHQKSQIKAGKITYEAIKDETIPSVINFMETEQCFIQGNNCWEKYQRGFTLAVEDTQETFVLYPCLLNSMRLLKIRSKLVIPIIVQSQLWGLLIAHQCEQPRQWEQREKTFLQQIAEHLAIAIYQAHIYTELQQEKFLLEKRVIERTQDLHDALIMAEAANQAKVEFLAVISHELRTPLTSVIGLSSTLLHWIFSSTNFSDKQSNAKLSPEKQKHYLQTIHDSGEHLLELIDNILEISQLEAGKNALKITTFSLGKVAKEVSRFLEEKAINKQVNIQLELLLDSRFKSDRKLHQNTGTYIHEDLFTADERRVKQILLHLLSNAIKFTAKGGEIILRIWREEETAVLQVEDTGIGIPENQLKVIFAKFKQVESAHKRNYEGLGLGLALTQKLVELHGGNINVKSTLGQGAVFTVWLPNQLGDKIETKKTESPPINHENKPLGTIILVQENEENATLICNVLTIAEYQLVWLMDSSSAITQIKLLRPKLVILDLDLIQEEVVKLITKLKSSELTRNVKILLISKVEQSEYLQLGMKAGADDYLLDSMQPEQLVQKIDKLIN